MSVVSGLEDNVTQPPNGQPLPPYGQQSPFGSGGYPPMTPPDPPVKQRNGFAIAGIVLAILLVWPLGLIFSIIGLVKSKARHGAGRALSIAGIIVSLLLLPAIFGLGVIVAILTNSPSSILPTTTR
jgi:hypothetical protein